MPTFALDTETYEKREDGMYHEILNAQKAVLGCMIEEGKKKPWSFDLENKPESMWEFMLKRIRKEGKRGRVCTFWALNHAYDFAGYARNHFHEVQPMSYNPFIHKIDLEKLNDGEKDSDDYEDYEQEKEKPYQAWLLDIGNFFRHMPLKKIGEIVNEHKGTRVPVIMHPKQLTDYCAQDCRVVLTALQKLKNALATMGYKPRRFSTAPRMAMSFFRKVLNDQKVISNSGNTVTMEGYWFAQQRIHPISRPEMAQMASRGGRVELITLRRDEIKDCYKLDINSQYPYVCCNMPFPDLLKEEYVENPTIEVLRKIGITEATMKAPRKYIPYLPIRHMRSICPTNRIMRAHWTNFELKQAIKEGYEVIDLHQSLVWEELPFNPFKAYFEPLYKLKEESTEEIKEVAKMLMNSLTGRFAYQKEERDIKRIKRIEIEKYTKEGYEVIADCSDSYVIVKKITEKKKYSKTSNPIIYALITAYARDMLYQQMKKIPQEDILYCATDAIILKGKENLERFEIGKMMGQWKIEEEGTAQFWSENVYCINEQLKISGTRKGNMTVEDVREGRQITSKTMNTLRQGWKTGDFSRVGTFWEKPINFQMKCKRQMALPQYIEEIPPSRMTTIVEILK